MSEPQPSAGVTTTTKTTVEVVAPSNLEAGFHLKVEVGGKEQVVIVPEGGVKEGEKFTGEVVDDATECPAAVGVKVGGDFPQGAFRDGIWDCCSNGLCHAMCCLATFCPAVVMGQILTRLHLNFIGQPTDDHSNTYRNVLIMWCISLFMYIVLGSINSRGLQIVVAIWGWIYFIYLVVTVMFARANARQKYNIETKTCGAAEDCCCAFWCNCCSIQQIARHTHDYKAQDVPCCDVNCFNSRGLPVDAPECV